MTDEAKLREFLEKYGSAYSQAKYWLNPDNDQGETKQWMGESYINLFTDYQNEVSAREAQDKIIAELREQQNLYPPEFRQTKAEQENDILMSRLKSSEKQNEELIKELNEAARLSGMSGSRETKLMAERNAILFECDEFRTQVDRLTKCVRIMDEALKEIIDADSVGRLIIADMGFTHFAKHTAQNALGRLEKENE